VQHVKLARYVLATALGTVMAINVDLLESF